MRQNIVTPADENGYCAYQCREESDPVHGTIVKCDYQGTCDYKLEKGQTARKVIHTCNNILPADKS